MTPEEKQAHADRLRRAIEESKYSRHDIALAVDKEYRTIGYWTAQTNPVMPNGKDRATLRKILGDYDSPGDAVERAIRASGLDDWRQTRLISEYQRHLHEQRAEAAM